MYDSVSSFVSVGILRSELMVILPVPIGNKIYAVFFVWLLLLFFIKNKTKTKKHNHRAFHAFPVFLIFPNSSKQYSLKSPLALPADNGSFQSPLDSPVADNKNRGDPIPD